MHIDKSRVNIALPTEAKTAQLFEKILMGGISRVNTWLAFDTNIFLSNKYEESKRQDLKIVYDKKIRKKVKQKESLLKYLK